MKNPYIIVPAFLMFGVFFGEAYGQQVDLQPLPAEIFTRTEQFLQRYIQQGKQPQTLLESVEFNNQSEIKIADEADVFTMLVRTGPSTATLKYYTLDGELKWERRIDFPPVQLNRISHELSNTGHRVLVKFDGYIKTLFDENANETGTIDDYIMLEMAPSGNFYYPVGEGLYVHSRFRIYDANLQLITKEKLGFLETVDRDKFDYQYEYRVIDADKLILMVSKFNKDGELTAKILYVYDLQNQRLEFTKNLIESNGQIYKFNIGKDDITIRDEIIVMAGFLAHNVIFLEIDLGQGQERIHDQFSSYRQIVLSDDTKKLFEFGFKNIQIYKLDQQTIEKTLPLQKRIPLILSMKTSEDSLWVTSIMYPEKTQRLTTFSLPQGRQLEEMVGWFNKKMNLGVLPIRSNISGNIIKLIKLEQLNQ